jgi:hypothetical protein
MDDLENRLHDALDAAGRGVGGSDSLGSAVRRKVRRRQARAGALAALPVVLLVVGAVWILGADDDTADVDTFQPNPPSSSVAPVDDPLRDALVALGADVDGAPADAATLGDAEWCGVDEVSSLTGELDDTGPSGCLIDATEAGRDAALVRVETTIEGDPIVTVAWTRSARFDAPVFIDSSQDAFGRPGWTELRCDLTIDDSAPVRLTWQNCVEAGTDPLRTALSELGVALAGAPEEAVTLDGAQWCGVDSAVAPNPDARRCLWDAWQTGAPAVGVLSATTIEGAPLIEVLRIDVAGVVVRWVDATRDPFGSFQWEGPWYCRELEVTEGQPISPGGCDNVPPGGSAVDEADITGARIIDVAPAESVDLLWPDQSFLGSLDRVPLYLLGEAEANQARVWAAAGEARRNDDGTATLSIVGPTQAAVLEHTEFGVATFESVQGGDYQLAIPGGVLRDRGDPVVVRLTGSADRVAAAAPPGINPSLAVLRTGGVGSVDFGRSRADTVAALEAEFGVDVVYTEYAACVTTGFARVGDFLVVEFWGDDAGPETGFEKWYYGPSWFDQIDGATGRAEIGLTTESGIGIGSSFAEVVAVGGGASGSYDASWGAAIWFENSAVAGELSADATDRSAAVASITGGRSGAPARQVC